MNVGARAGIGVLASRASQCICVSADTAVIVPGDAMDGTVLFPDLAMPTAAV